MRDFLVRGVFAHRISSRKVSPGRGIYGINCRSHLLVEVEDLRTPRQRENAAIRGRYAYAV